MKKYLSFFSLLALTSILTASPPYQKDWREKLTSGITEVPHGEGGNYTSAIYTNHIDKASVQVILEVGSRDAFDALQLSELYQCHVFAFECNPEAIKLCEQHIGSNPNISLVPYAAWNQTRKISFYPALPSRYGSNLGGSSLFIFNPQGPDSYPQSQITVDAIRLDEWCVNQQITQIDLLCMDTQGATLQILQGLGSYLHSVKYIITEADYQRYYLGEALYPEINAFLIRNGFTQVAIINRGNLYGNPLYIRNDLLAPIDSKF